MKHGVAVCLFVSCIVVSQAFRILVPSDIYQPRKTRLQPLQNVVGPDLIPSAYPAHDEFLKQLITYLESVGKK